MPDDSAFYATAAQVLPLLVLAALASGSLRPTPVTHAATYNVRTWLLLLTILSGSGGEFSAFAGLHGGDHIGSTSLALAINGSSLLVLVIVDHVVGSLGNRVFETEDSARIRLLGMLLVALLLVAAFNVVDR